MANRARSTIRALHILGNSIRGLDFANWRSVYHAIILPVLTYGSPLWAQKPTKSLLKIVRVAQNDALRRISGCFRTTPTAPLPHLLAILPIEYTLGQLIRSFGDRLLRLPPSHSLRTMTVSDPNSLWGDSPIPTSLSRLLPPTPPPPYFPPRHPSLRSWSHPFFTPPPITTPDVNEDTRRWLQTPTGLRLFVLTRCTADAPIGFFALFHGPSIRPVYCGQVTGPSTTEAQWSALLQGMAHVPEFPNVCPLIIFLPNKSLLPYITNLGKHRYLPQTTQFTALLDDFISESSPTEIRLFSPKWKNMPYALALASSEAAPGPTPPTTPPSQRARAFQQWGTDYDASILPRRGTAWLSVTRPEGPTPPPFTLGALSHRNRRYFTACMQLTTRHCFDADYSLKFRSKAKDEVRCHCNFSRHLDGSAVSGGPTRGRTNTEAGSQRNAVGTPLDFDALQRLYLDPRATPEDDDAPPPRRQRFTTHNGLHLYSLRHVLTACPHNRSLRQKFLRNMPLEELFRSELGSSQLCRFLHFSQDLLRPLPPRPDPP